MGKRHHSKDTNSDNIYLCKLFALFYLMNSLTNKKISKDINSLLLNGKSEDDEDFSENTDINPADQYPENKLYIPVNTDSLTESYKKALAGDLEIPEQQNIRQDMEAEDFKEDCKTSVISEMLPLCENMAHTDSASKEEIIIKIPVVLAECTAAVNMEASNKLDDDVSEIIRISRHVFLNLCKLAADTEKISVDTSILFLDGFVRENIEYCAENSSDKGKLKYTEVNIPFKCAAKVDFKIHPELKWNEQQDESVIINPSVNDDCCEKGKSILCNGKDSFKISEFFNEKIFCRLTGTEINGTHTFENKSEKKSPIITEKSTLFLTVELLQKHHIKLH